jgi:hypothetical protein
MRERRTAAATTSTAIVLPMIFHAARFQGSQPF